MKNLKPNKKALQITVTVISCLACVFLIPLLLFNTVYAVKAALTPSSLPSVFGYMPLIETGDEMDGDASGISANDLLFFKASDAYTVGQVVVVKIGSSYSVRRVQAVSEQNGNTLYTLTNSKSTVSAAEQNIEGAYAARVGSIGALILFSRTTLGLVLFIALPLLLIVAAYVTTSVVKEQRDKKAMAAAAASAQQSLAHYIEHSKPSDAKSVTADKQNKATPSSDTKASA